MILKNSLIYFNQFFFFISKHIKKFYLNSNIYNKKLLRGEIHNFIYKPSPSLLDCLIKYSKKNNINEFTFNNVWTKQNLEERDFKSLHNFFWLCSLDLNSSKKEVQLIISNWINKNNKYDEQIWDTDTLSKRIISWISNSKITFENSDADYKSKFNEIIKKQINHLINDINSKERIDDKIVGCSAIILSGLAYNEKKKFLGFGLNLLERIIKFSFDKNNFPKSRNIRQINFFLKYFILIREWLKESQNEIPEYLDEIIFYIGQSHNLIFKNIGETFLFNGNQKTNISEFENYLKRLGYNFKTELNEIGGYAILKNKRYAIAMDMGPSPDKNFSSDYQSGALSFEFLSNKKKIITNSGYFQNYKHQLNFISKTSACHSTLSVQNHSSAQFYKTISGATKIENPIKVSEKKIISTNDLWCLEALHDGFLKRFGVKHKRRIEFFPEKEKIIGTDFIFRKEGYADTHFEIRFHLSPQTKIMKTQDGKSIYIDVSNEGWKFSGKNCSINYETGLFFGLKNNFIENQNIVISGEINGNEQTIVWELEKIQ